MIHKRDLLNGLDELVYQLMKQGEEIRLLQHRVSKLEGAQCTCPKAEKRGRGRPRKNCGDDLEKAIKDVATLKSAKAKGQPRDKAGKFAKK